MIGLYPNYLLDLSSEFRCQTNGLSLPAGKGLIGALSANGLEHISFTEKEAMQQLALRGGPYSAAEQLALTDYCQTDVDALTALLPEIATEISIDHALIPWPLHAGSCQHRIGRDPC